MRHLTRLKENRPRGYKGGTEVEGGVEDIKNKIATYGSVS